VFSASRAKDILGRVLDRAPHFVGTAANARMRQQILEEFRHVGYEPTVQEASVCSREGTCARVSNVLARLPGTGPGKAVMLACHYDSVGAGPGASDDGMGVAAVLEIAKILKSEPPRRNSIVFLIDDGEEAGLLGAEAFAAEHPWAHEIGAVVNLEARGTSGASLLFETSEDNRWLVRLAAAALPRPNTSSIFYTIYKYLPNDTDLTVFRAYRMPGVNFACVGDVAHYHTPLDNFKNASPATLQHHGENALAMARALAGADLDLPHRGNAVFFDVFGAAIWGWPDEATLPLAVAAVLLVAMSIRRRIRRGELNGRATLWGIVAALAMLAAPIATCLAAVGLLKVVGALPTQWVAHPQWLLISLWLLSVLAAWVSADKLAARAGGSGFWAGIWLLWSFTALVLAVIAPGLSFVFLVPALAAGLVGWSDSRWSFLVAPAAASFFWLPIAWFLYDGLGSRSTAVLAASVALTASTLAPAFSNLAQDLRRKIVVGLAAAAAVSLLVTSVSRPFSADSPERMQIGWHGDADSGKSRWLVFPESGALPPAIQEAMSFTKAPVPPFPWSLAATAFAANASGLPVSGPEWILREDSPGPRRHVRATVRSPRGAPILLFAFSPSSLPESISIGGKRLPELDRRAAKKMGRWRIYSCLTAPPEGVEVEIVWPDRRAIEFLLGDESSGLPAGGERLASARPRTAATSQGGDLSVVTRRVRL
jgi:hypothetical protein